MNNETRAAITSIIDYLHADEERNYEESGKPQEHIYRDILTVQKYLEDGDSITQTINQLVEFAYGVNYNDARYAPKDINRMAAAVEASLIK